MQWRNQPDRYGWISILFHWLSAIGVLFLFTSGFYMVDLDYYSRWYVILPNWHQLIGITLMIITLVRWVNTAIQSKPHALIDERWMQRIASTAHALLLILLSFVLVSGYAILSDDVILYGDTVIPIPKLGLDADWLVTIGVWHRWSSYGLMGLVTLHTAAALKHHFIDKDMTLTRMMGVKRQAR